VTEVAQGTAASRPGKPPMTDVKLLIQRLPSGHGLPLPSHQSADAAGLDLVAAVPEATPLTLVPGARGLVPCGIAIAIPRGFEGQVRPRSGLAVRQGVTVLNAPGTIDADYRGEVMVLLVNLGTEPFAVTRGMRIAQLVIAPVVRAEVVEAEALDATVRGDGGFGSTGTQ
jgi:dUTP pyrophosphatase